MPNWAQIQQELNSSAAAAGGIPDYDGVRRKHLAVMHQLTGRPTILYYGNWLGTSSAGPRASISLDDIHGFMTAVSGLMGDDLDLLLHTSGGDPNAAERIVEYLRHKFSGEIRVFVPVAAMSAGTMIALAGDLIVMASHSQLGPIDPQIPQPIGGQFRLAPAGAPRRQFAKARAEIMQNPAAAAAWQPILQTYGTALLELCESAEDLSKELVQQWLERWMLSGQHQAATGPATRGTRRRIEERRTLAATRRRAAEIAQWFASWDEHHSHGRGISRDLARSRGVHIDDLEDSQMLQDAVLSVHHSLMHMFDALPMAKIIENHLGDSFVRFQNQ